MSMKAIVRSSESIVSLGIDPATIPQKRQSGSGIAVAGYLQAVEAATLLGLLALLLAPDLSGHLIDCRAQHDARCRRVRIGGLGHGHGVLPAGAGGRRPHLGPDGGAVDIGEMDRPALPAA